MAQVAGIADQEIVGELDSNTGILYNSDGTQMQLPPGTELKTVMTTGGQVKTKTMVITPTQEKKGWLHE